MLKCVGDSGKLKIPVKAYRTHGNEFLIYETGFGAEQFKDAYQNRICILNARPTAHIVADLQMLLELNGYRNYVLVLVTV
jgi:hypothetical protein